MALAKCPDCGKMVSSRVTNCPDCGCPADFFEKDGVELKEEKAMLNIEYREFSFKENVIKYPKNSELFASLYGDYLKLGFEKYEALCKEYKNLGDADSVAKKLANKGQQIIDGQIDIILKLLYSNGLSMTIEQFKRKYEDVYPINFDMFMEPFMTEYCSILGKQAQMQHDREVSYANRMRWSGGGFGMTGAIKGAIQAGVLNIGTSMISGMGNAVVASFNEGSIERRKERLFENKKIMSSTCEGIIVCMNGLFYAYTDELFTLGKLGDRINIDIEAANAKFEAMMRYENNKERILSTVVECLGLYPASREFYEKAEMELEECRDWKLFKEFWHLDFIYREVETAYLKTTAKVDGERGALKLYDNVLVFDADNPKYNKRVAIGTIRKVEKQNTFFNISLKGKFLMLALETPMDEVWIDIINNAINGKYEKISVENLAELQQQKQNLINEKGEVAKEYILKNFTRDQRIKAIAYYRDNVGVPTSEASKVIDAIFPIFTEEELQHTYPGTEDLPNGYFRGERVVLYGGGNIADCYTILTTKELIYIDIKKKKEDKYDIFKISKLKPEFLGFVFSFKYQGSFIEKTVSAQGKADEFIEKIQNMQKGIF